MYLPNIIVRSSLYQTTPCTKYGFYQLPVLVMLILTEGKNCFSIAIEFGLVLLLFWVGIVAMLGYILALGAAVGAVLERCALSPEGDLFILVGLLNIGALLLIGAIFVPLCIPCPFINWTFPAAKTPIMAVDPAGGMLCGALILGLMGTIGCEGKPFPLNES